jgi:small basic protein
LFLLHLFFELKLPDYNFIQVYKKSVLEAVQGDVRARSTGFVTPELVIRAHRKGFQVVAVPIKYLPREAGVARSGAVKVIVATMRDLLAFWWSGRR